MPKLGDLNSVLRLRHDVCSHLSCGTEVHTHVTFRDQILHFVDLDVDATNLEILEIVLETCSCFLVVLMESNHLVLVLKGSTWLDPDVRSYSTSQDMGYDPRCDLVLRIEAGVEMFGTEKNTLCILLLKS